MRKFFLFPYPLLFLLLPFVSGCEQIGALLDLPDPKKEAAHAEAESRAVGGACRHAGRSLEDCYVLNPAAQKAWVFAGWKEMNDYMMANKIEVVPSKLPQTVPSGMAEGAAPAAAQTSTHTAAPVPAAPAAPAAPTAPPPKR